SPRTRRARAVSCGAVRSGPFGMSRKKSAIGSARLASSRLGSTARLPRGDIGQLLLVDRGGLDAFGNQERIARPQMAIGRGVVALTLLLAGRPCRAQESEAARR